MTGSRPLNEEVRKNHTEPDKAVQAYLEVIAAEPNVVAAIPGKMR